MKRALVRTSFLLSHKLSCTNPFDKTCIDNTELKFEIMNIAIDRETDGVAKASLALLAVSNYFDSKYLNLYYSSNTITIDKETTQPTFLYVGIYKLLFDSYRLQFKRAGFTKTKYTCQLRVYLRMPQSATRKQLPLRRLRVNLAKSND